MLITNFLTGEKIIFSPLREKRGQVNSLSKNNKMTCNNKCPFCIENIEMITEPVYTSLNNEIRVIANKYPIAKDNPIGEHYVIIDALQHDNDITKYSKEHLYFLMKCLQDMILRLDKDTRLKSVQVFKNHGSRAGATQEHSHWQILGIETETTKELKIKESFQKYFDKTNSCYLCDNIKNKYLKNNNYIIQNDYFIAFCSEDSLFPNTITISPKQHLTNFKNLDDKMLENLGVILQTCILKLNTLISDLNYNICLYNSLNSKDEYHFFIEIIPRVGNFAGFEFLSGMYVNSVMPTEATKTLREIQVNNNK